VSQALQKSIDVINEADADPLLAAKARALMRGYDVRWAGNDWFYISDEEMFQLPIINPETGKSSRTFTHSGRYDGRILDRNGGQWLLEHKTCSEDIEDPAATYWRRLVIDSQVSGYVLANWQDGRKLTGTLYDVIRKPGIRPKKIPKAEQTHIVANGQYHGFSVPHELRMAVSGGQDSECPRLFEMRLARDCIDNSLRYFQRRPIPRLDNDLLEYAGELWDVAQTIMDARRTERHYRNSSACVTFNTPCEFLSVCSGFDSVDSDRWRKAEMVHDELDLDGDGRSVLTNSRIKCFQTCRRKHYLRYELGIRRVDAEEREALVFGALLHQGLAAWWSCQQEQVHGNDNAASEAAWSD
jgi:hypothetical protein